LTGRSISDRDVIVSDSSNRGNNVLNSILLILMMDSIITCWQVW